MEESRRGQIAVTRKVRPIKLKKKHQSNNEGNVDTKSNNGVQIVDGKWMCLCNKGCGFNKSHTTGFYDTWAACVKNNQPFTLPATHVFKKMVSGSNTVPQVASNNGGGTQYPPPINVGTSPDLVVSLHHMGDAVPDSQYSVQKKAVCEHHKNYVSDPEISSFISDLQKACNLN